MTGLAQLLDGSTGVELEAAKAVKPKSRVLWLLGISLGSTAAAAAVTLAGGAAAGKAEKAPGRPPVIMRKKPAQEQTFPDKMKSGFYADEHRKKNRFQNRFTKREVQNYGQVYVYSDRDPRCCGH